MKVGDYYRTKYGINKLTDGKCVLDNIIKSSPNIIDLIEVGDVVTFKDDEDVYRIIGIPNKECDLEVFYLAKNYDGNTEDIMVYPDEMQKYIKSIVTREMFESMEYKVGE